MINPFLKWGKDESDESKDECQSDSAIKIFNNSTKYSKDSLCNDGNDDFAIECGNIGQ